MDKNIKFLSTSDDYGLNQVVQLPAQLSWSVAKHMSSVRGWLYGNIRT